MSIITPADIRRGDLFVGSSLEFDWTALNNPVTYNLTGQNGGTALRVEVQYDNGDIGWRYWNSDTETRFEIVADIPGGGRRLAPIYL